jgi:3-oxoadipate enol-lactonase
LDQDKPSLSKDPDIHFRECGSGPPLLLIHGLLATGVMFDPVADALARHHRLIIPDLRGSGKSRHLPPPLSAKQQAEDLARLLDYLDIQSADVLGYSHGGAIAQQFALDHPARVNRLVLASTYAHNMVTIRERLEGRLVPLLIRLLGMRRLATYVLTLGMKQIPAERTKGIIDMIADQDRDSMIATWKQAMAFDSRSRLTEIACPTLIIAGADDNAVPMHHPTMLHEGIKDSRLVMVEQADHAMIWTSSERLVQVVEAFVQSSCVVNPANNRSQ